MLVLSSAPDILGDLVPKILISVQPNTVTGNDVFVDGSLRSQNEFLYGKRGIVTTDLGQLLEGAGVLFRILVQQTRQTSQLLLRMQDLLFDRYRRDWFGLDRWSCKAIVTLIFALTSRSKE